MVELKNIPGVDTLICNSEVKSLTDTYGQELVNYSIKKVLGYFREKKTVPPIPVIIDNIKSEIEKITTKNLRAVINATGVIIHTNIGRAPLGEAIINEVSEILKGYCNLEFDLQKASRGSRYSHVTNLLKYLTEAEDVLVVNNNAAAVMLILRTFAKNKEVIISRGELIEIGGSFRLPEIMKASDCLMTEVGTTNKTSIRDYENAINDNTSILLKAHKSNYIIKGFTQEATLPELSRLGKKHNIIAVYDIGSGLLRKSSIEILQNEPDVKQALSSGVDLVCFSGDKLLGGPQAGLIAGKKELIARLKNEPMNRAFRVGKTTLALLESTCLHYLKNNTLYEKNPVYKMLKKTPEELKINALKLQEELKTFQIKSSVISSKGQSGGGSLPGKEIESYAVKIEKEHKTNKEKSEFAEKMYTGLLKLETPVLGILRKGNVLFDVLTIPDDDIPKVARFINEVYKTLMI